MRKIQLTAIFLLASLIFAGCGSKDTSSNKTNQGSTSSKVTTTTKSASSKKEATQSSKKQVAKTPWNQDKDKQLEDFINQWAPTMGQSYTKYDGNTPLKTSTGTVYPDSLSQVTVDGSSASIGWSKDGTGSNEYNVVAIYNYNGVHPPLPNHITYCFAFHNGKPVALVDESRDGTPVLTETKNTKVKTSFEKIAGNSANTSVSKSETKVSNKATAADVMKDPKYVGVLMYQLIYPSDQIEKESYWDYWTNEYNFLGHGHSATTIKYKINGNNVDYWTRDYSTGKTVADAPSVKHTTSLKKLVEKYYKTDEQKKIVEDIVHKIDNPTID